jgi:E3 ubiquitin-protein ligase MARCH6
VASREVIAPVAGGLLAMIVLPGAIFRLLQLFIFPSVIDDRFICAYLVAMFTLSTLTVCSPVMHGYPGIFAVAGFFRTAVLLINALSAWSQSIRDKEFLVEMRLRNLEPEKVESLQGLHLTGGGRLELEEEEDGSDNVL